jgi:hypothetical protein
MTRRASFLASPAWLIAGAIAAACGGGGQASSGTPASSSDDASSAEPSSAEASADGSLDATDARPDTSPTSPGDAAPADGSVCAALAVSDGGCNTVAPGTPVAIRCSTSPAPKPAGGPIADGTYRLASSTFYGSGGDCPAGETDAITWVVCGKTWMVAETITLKGTTLSMSMNFSVNPAGHDLYTTGTCGGMTMSTFGYDATPTGLRLYVSLGAGSVRVDTFKRE